MSFVEQSLIVRASRRQRNIRAAAIVCALGAATLVPAWSVAQNRNESSPADQGYAIGYDLGKGIAEQLESDGVSADRAAIAKGFTDALNGRKSTMNDDQMEQVLTDLHRRVAERVAQGRYQRDPVFRALADRNKATGDSFREAFAQREGAETLPSGVIYSTVREGTGEEVGDASVVVANFVAMLPSGEEFARGRGREFSVATLLPGARDFVRKMHVGERAYVAVPPERAHGLAGSDDAGVGPNETVVLDVEIVAVKR